MLIVKVCPVCQREYSDDATACTEDSVPVVAMVRDAQTRSEDLLGTVVEGRWRVERVIGKGGMGTVYACRHVVVGKVGAMKVLRAGADRSEAVLQRFVREAQTANLLRSRHIVEVSDFGQLPSGALFVVMELLEGQDLARAMRAQVGRLGRRELVHVFTQVAETLHLAHEKGIVHRDLKPDNIFLVDEAGDPLFVKLLDFGIAKVLHGDGAPGLTETGVILGTPYYMSPEQARAESVDHRTDIYALGVMMYRAFTGRLPFMADSTMGVLTRHITEAPRPPSEIGNVDTPTERMILRCLAKRPEYRFQSMRELADALRSLPLEGTSSLPQGALARVASPGPLPLGTSPALPGLGFGPPKPESSAGGAALHREGSTSAHPAATSGSYGASAPYPVHQGPSGFGTFTPPGPYHARASADSGAHMTGSGPALMSVPTPSASGPLLAAPLVEPTTRGVAASSNPMPASRGPSNALVLVVGALSTAAIGAVAAVIVVGRTAPAAPSAPAVPTVVVVAPPPSTAPITPAASPSASTSAAAIAASSVKPADSAAVAPTPPARLRGGAPRPPPTPATAAPTGPKLPRDVRSPFD
jgi:serine/threonine-protein kinase